MCIYAIPAASLSLTWIQPQVLRCKKPGIALQAFGEVAWSKWGDLHTYTSAQCATLIGEVPTHPPSEPCFAHLEMGWCED